MFFIVQFNKVTQQQQFVTEIDFGTRKVNIENMVTRRQAGNRLKQLAEVIQGTWGKGGVLETEDACYFVYPDSPNAIYLP